MPKSVMVHIGCTSGPYITTSRPPEWLAYAVEQYFTFNDSELYILTDQENIPYLPKHSGLVPVAIESYYSDKIDRFHAVYKCAPRDFWTVAATRLIYLENFMRENNLRHIYHFENDVLLYFNITEYHSVFRRLYPSVAITPEGPQKVLTGFIYIDNYEALADMTEFFVEMLEQYGEDGLREKYGVITVHEMLLMAEYGKGHKDCVAYLPIIPFGEHSQGFNEFGAIFDPISWGELVDGTREGGRPGSRFPRSYIGQIVVENPDYAIVWRIQNGLWCPYFSYDGNLAKINNLHIHSKNLMAFMSKRL